MNTGQLIWEAAGVGLVVLDGAETWARIIGALLALAVIAVLWAARRPLTRSQRRMVRMVRRIRLVRPSRRTADCEFEEAA